MPVVEFQIRAWKMDETHAQVLVHSSTAGDIRKPITVACNIAQLREAGEFFRYSEWLSAPGIEKDLATLGRRLADVLLPRPVYALLTSSLQALHTGSILRLRLCLDSALVDLPWEYLYRPDMDETNSITGFLLFDHRISLVREAPTITDTPTMLNEKQRMLFVGALWSAGGKKWDKWSVRAEYEKLTRSLAPVSELLSLEFIPADDDIELSLKKPASILHYSGHTDTDNTSGYLVREVKADRQDSDQVESLKKMYSFELAQLLKLTGTRLAVFSACNSGRWAFVEPLLRAGLPAVIGVQGVVSVQGAIIFFETLYAKLAVGLSLDEALSAARFQLFKEGGDNVKLEWGNFMAYMPITESILLPREPEQAGVVQFQETSRLRSQQAVADVEDRMGKAPEPASAINQSSLRKAIVRSFTLDEEAVLCADIKNDLYTDGVEMELDLDVLGGRLQGEEALVQKMIDYLDRRGYLSYLVSAVRRDRPGII